MGETKRMGQSHLGQPREGRQPKPIRQAENEIPVFALFAILANMDPRTMSELIAKKNFYYTKNGARTSRTNIKTGKQLYG